MPELTQPSEGGFWSSEILKRRLPDIVSNYDENAVKASGYELGVGGEVFVSGESSEVKLLTDGETVAIPPGQLALILTYERIKAPMDAVGLLSIKFGRKVKGLINVSGFHVDPGFEGNLVFSVYNAGVQTVHLRYRSPLFLLWFCSIQGQTADKYKGEHNLQEHLPDEAVTALAQRMPSPFTLENDLKALRSELETKVGGVETRVTVLTTLIVAMLVGLFIASLKNGNTNAASNTSQNMENASPASTTGSRSSTMTPSPSTTATATQSLNRPAPGRGQ